MRRHGATVSLLPWLLAFAAGCKPPSSETLSIQTALSLAGTDIWKSMVTGPQTACKPIRLQPREQPAGVAVLVHDFLGCPKDMEPLGLLLAEAGFEVLLPLLPGHGHTGTDPGPLPAEDDFMERYGGLAQDIARLSRETSGRAVIAGAGLGGAVATYALTNSRFQAALLISPQFGASPAWARQVLGEFQHLPNIFDLPADARHAIRRLDGNCTGTCVFEMRHALAAHQFGFNVAEDRLPTEPVDMQVFISQDDPVCDGERQAEIVTRLTRRANVTACVLRTDQVPPSVATAFRERVKMLDSGLRNAAARFLESGTAAAQRSEKSTLEFSYCAQ